MYENPIKVARDIESGMTSIGKETTRMRLIRQTSELERELVTRKALLKLLDENPVIEQFMDLSSGGY